MDEMAMKVENIQPKLLNSVWKNVDKIDTGFQFKEKTYFFKGSNFYEFDEENKTIHFDKPQKTLEYWLSCPPIPEEKSSAITIQCSLLFILFASILSQIY